MREISPGVLWIGNAGDARDLKSVLGHRIEAMIDLALEESPIAVPRELIDCRFPLVDGQGNSPAVVEAAINTAVLFVTARMPTLISCGGGMSRSPAIAAAVVARINNIPPDEAMKRVAAEGPHDVAPLSLEGGQRSAERHFASGRPTHGKLRNDRRISSANRPGEREA